MGADVTADVLGSTVARVRGAGAGRLIALFAHADQIGLIVRGVGEDGLVTVARLGSWRVRGRGRPARADRRARGRGSRCRRGAARREARLGDVADRHRCRRSRRGARDRPAGRRRRSRRASRGVAERPRPAGALDDRVGIFACLEVLRRVAADPPEWDFAVVVSVQEETSSHAGARVAAERLAPDVAIAVDVTYAGDAPGTAPWGDVRLGGGPTIFRGPVVSPIVGDGLLVFRGDGGGRDRDRVGQARRGAMPMTSSWRPGGSPARSSASRCATCTRPARSRSCRT